MPVIKRYDCYGENILIVGMAQQGKSHLLEALIQQELQTYRDASNISHPINWWLFDPRHQHRNPLLGAKIIHEPEGLAEGKYILQPQKGKTDEAYDKFLTAAMNIWNLVIIIEEIQLFCGKQALPPLMKELITSGCNTGNTYIALTQRPAEIHNAILSNSHHRYVFRLQWLNDVDVVGKWLGSPETVEWLRTSPPHHYLYHYYLDSKPGRCNPI